MNEDTHRHINENQDSIELGTPARGGVIKIYGDASKPIEFAEKIAQMLKLRERFAEEQKQFEEKTAKKKE